MQTGRKTLIGFLLLAAVGCVQVGPSDDKPIHIILDVNVRVQVDKAVESLWNEVEQRAKAAELAPNPTESKP